MHTLSVLLKFVWPLTMKLKAIKRYCLLIIITNSVILTSNLIGHHGENLHQKDTKQTLTVFSLTVST